MLVQIEPSSSPPAASWEDPLAIPGQPPQQQPQPQVQQQPPQAQAYPGTPQLQPQGAQQVVGGGTPHYVSKAESGAISEAKKTSYIIIAVLIVGLALLVIGIISFGSDKVVGELKDLDANSFASVIIFCSPCGQAQEDSLRTIIGDDGMRNRFHGSLQADRLLVTLSGLEIKRLAEKEWVKKIVQNTE